jgi:hypothetical protein
VLPHALRRRARHLAGAASGATTCLMAPHPPPAQEGPGVATRLRHQEHHPTGFRYHHVSCGSRPASWCGRAPEPPRAQWLSALGHARMIPRRMTLGSSWPRQTRGASSALNTYVIGHIQRMIGIKCVQDNDAVGWLQYNVDLWDIRNIQAIVRGDLMSQHSKAATVPGDPSTRTISHMGAMWRSDVTWHSSDHQHHHWLFLARVPLWYRVQLPWGHLSGLGAQCDRSILVLQQATIGITTLKATQGNREKSQCLSNITPILLWT